MKWIDRQGVKFRPVFRRGILITAWVMGMMCMGGCSGEKSPECDQKQDECAQYACFFPGCDCLPVPAESPENWGKPAFAWNQPVTSTETAKVAARAFLQAGIVPEASLKDADELGHGWFFATFSGVKKEIYEYLIISPAGNFYPAGCGV